MSHSLLLLCREHFPLIILIFFLITNYHIIIPTLWSLQSLFVSSKSLYGIHRQGVFLSEIVRFRVILGGPLQERHSLRISLCRILSHSWVWTLSKYSHILRLSRRCHNEIIFFDIGVFSWHCIVWDSLLECLEHGPVLWLLSLRLFLDFKSVSLDPILKLNSLRTSLSGELKD